MKNKILEKFIHEAQSYVTKDMRGDFYILGELDGENITPVKYGNCYIFSKNLYKLNVNENMDSFVIKITAEFNNCVLFNHNLQTEIGTNDPTSIDPDKLNKRGVSKLYDDTYIYYYTSEGLNMTIDKYYHINKRGETQAFSENDKKKIIKKIYG